MVTPVGLRAWSKRVRAEARGGGGEGILRRHRRAISAYTWRKDHNWKRTHSEMPLPEPDGAIGEAQSGRVREAGRVEERGER